jgi:hypothetical protein
VVKSAKASDILLLDLTIAEVAEDISVRVGWVGNNYTPHLRTGNLQCFSLVHEDLFVFMEQITSLHSLFSWKPA